ncbi:MAG: helix-turn-helix transcriptional regulator [Caldilinea sp. CFX5]|nr:helix-turn-helix transcriptional regulator [Caldilinea sp. CFX5]
MRLPLLQTKLYIPSLRQQLVARPTITAKLGAGGWRPVTLVAAPAGFGKTTLVSAWATQAPQAVVWLSLDEDDNDPTRFLTYVLAALQTQQPAIGAGVQELLNAPQAPLPKAVLTLLLNDLNALTTPLALVLDDYHLITTPAIHEALTFFIDHLPPPVHLIFTTRIDPPLPLARWRARNQLVEIRADDLRFRQEEAATFLNEIMGLTLTAAEITTLEARTEGWIAGLQLAALSLQGRSDVAGFMRAFSGSHRHVLSYLVEEVLDRRPEGTLDFLLQTAILGRLTAPLCDAVTGRSDSQVLLTKVEQANLFLIPLDDAGQWYRYHHLFAEVLRTRLQQSHPDLLPVLHHRASVWYEQHGLLAEAINHALAAEEWERAAGLLKPIVKEMVERVTLAGQAQTVLRWLKVLPVSVARTHPTLCFYHATALMFTNQLAAAEVWLQDAEQAVQPQMLPDEAHTILGWVAVIRADIARVRGDLASGVALAHQALAYLPATEALARAVGQMNVAHAYLFNGDVTQAAERLAAEAIAPLQKIGNLFATTIAITNLARLQALQGRCRSAAATFALAEQITPGGGQLQDLLNGAAFYIGLGDLLRERNELEAAGQQLTQGMELVRGLLSVDADVVTTGYIALAKLRHALGDLPGGLALLDEFVQLARERGYFAPLIARAEAVRTQLWLASGVANLAAASQWAAASGLHADDEDLPYLRESEYLTLARVLIAQQRTVEALRLLARLLPNAEAGGRGGRVIEIRLLQALALHAQKLFAEAYAALHHALSLAGGPIGAEDYIRLFVDEGEAMRFLIFDFRSFQARTGSDKLWIAQQPTVDQNSQLSVYVDKLLAAFGNEQVNAGEGLLAEQAQIQNPKSQIQNLVEPLSDREQEVLQLVAAGLSNSEIATRLIVTTGTIKTHINHIFSKLHVQSRTQAVARGRELGLLPK